MAYRDYLKYRIVQLHTKYGEYLSRRGVSKFIARYKERGTIRRKPGSGRPTKVNEEIQSFVESQVRKDDETTAYQLFHLLKDEGKQHIHRCILIHANTVNSSTVVHYQLGIIMLEREGSQLVGAYMYPVVYPSPLPHTHAHTYL